MLNIISITFTIMSENKQENAKYAMCYIPLVAIFLFFTEKNTSEEYKKHLKYGMILFGVYALTTTILNILWLSWFNGLVFLAYIGVSIYLGLKAYNGEKVDVEILNDISEKLDNKTDNKNNSKEL